MDNEQQSPQELGKLARYDNTTRSTSYHIRSPGKTTKKQGIGNHVFDKTWICVDIGFLRGSVSKYIE
eukprot:5154920-Amphidinium_carterae.1